MALGTHEELFEVIKLLKCNCNVKKSNLRQKAFSARSSQPSIVDQNSAVDMAAAILITLDTSKHEYSVVALESGVVQPYWKDEQTFSEFFKSAFHFLELMGTYDDFGVTDIDFKLSLSARKLKKHAGLKFKPTSDLKNHLRLSQKKDTLEIYHHIAFLKEHLRLTKKDNITADECLEIGAIPRQLALETLDSVQKILFRCTDPLDTKSHKLLSSLILSAGFDPDCKEFESSFIRSPDEKHVTYRYFNRRLAQLWEELENPRARNWLGKYLERKSGARYAMMATLVGLFIAIILGFASLAIDIYSAWIGYQQWQHPIGS